ncbi:hypothetical protein SPRG_06679 [Saprolegnia parasitica CBS 223.65]|uniref:DUF4211 domain-containing protein n=1 Tax=Saprolegnia parasitica (strain CBS 223.65) TaxID=695850 RepID=A0A067CPH1_SAPPC|nr:hypothetical protein SPRG_06679 [Saprolegnia parasitica CBS 223.65]KDO28441.1 hypothetical protein SPRG_06679 [Saprolegnia parasitica CBS 223.65]|eukprot:XP_012200881.1 hypothetical protein SPRG_06679 [Saprolegnia parasitica CBS 223.65]
MSSDDEVEIITPTKASRRRITEDDEVMGDMAASVPAPSMAKRRRITEYDSDVPDDSPDVSSSVAKRKALVVLDSDSDDDKPVTEIDTEEEKPAPRPGASRSRLQHRAGPLDGSRPPPRRRSRWPLRRSTPSDSAGDGDASAEDDDDFIVDDNHIEYMNDDEVATTNGIDEDNEEHVYSEEEDIEAYRASRMSRERHEWFSIYMDYLEHCMMDPAFETNNRNKIFLEAENHVERALCQRRDSLRGMVKWPDDLVQAIEHCPSLSHVPGQFSKNCEACERSEHLASIRVRFSGIRCGASELYKTGWSTHLQACREEPRLDKDIFVLGSVCFNRVLLYWSLHQAKFQWCELILRMINAANGEKPSENARKSLHAREFRRLKELENLVDNFGEGNQRSKGQTIRNVWKGVSQAASEESIASRPGHISRFFPPSNAHGQVLETSDDEIQTTTRENADANTETEDEDDDVRVVRKTRRHQQVYDDNSAQEDDVVPVALNASSESAVPQEAPSSIESEYDGERRNVIVVSSGRCEDDDDGDEEETKHDEFGDDDELVGESEDDIVEPTASVEEGALCLLCQARPRTAGMAHGYYVHIYCCFECGKKVFRDEKRCHVCTRPIDRVMHLLPLSTQAETWIRNSIPTPSNFQ